MFAVAIILISHCRNECQKLDQHELLASVRSSYTLQTGHGAREARVTPGKGATSRGKCSRHIVVASLVPCFAFNETRLGSPRPRFARCALAAAMRKPSAIELDAAQREKPMKLVHSNTAQVRLTTQTKPEGARHGVRERWRRWPA